MIEYSAANILGEIVARKMPKMKESCRCRDPGFKVYCVSGVLKILNLLPLSAIVSFDICGDSRLSRSLSAKV